MLAMALDDFSVCIVDVDIRRIVRTFTGHAGKLTDTVSSTSAVEAYTQTDNLQPSAVNDYIEFSWHSLAR